MLAAAGTPGWVTVIGTIGSLIAIWGVSVLVMRKAGHKGTSLLGRWAARRLWPEIVASMPEAAVAQHLPTVVSSAVKREIAPVMHQLNPVNGNTLAQSIEEVRAMVAAYKEQVDDLQSGMARVSVLVAEHVSDGHGGRTSW